MKKYLPISGELSLSQFVDQNTPRGVWTRGPDLVIASGGNVFPLTLPGGAALIEQVSDASAGGLDRDTVFKLDRDRRQRCERGKIRGKLTASGAASFLFEGAPSRQFDRQLKG